MKHAIEAGGVISLRSGDSADKTLTIEDLKRDLRELQSYRKGAVKPGGTQAIGRTSNRGRSLY